jgi:hypothetical protein
VSLESTVSNGLVTSYDKLLPLLQLSFDNNKINVGTETAAVVAMKAHLTTDELSEMASFLLNNVQVTSAT